MRSGVKDEAARITFACENFTVFQEFLMALDVTSCRDEREKLEWAFRLYDVDSSGSINLREVLAIMGTLEEVS